MYELHTLRVFYVNTFSFKSWRTWTQFEPILQLHHKSSSFQIIWDRARIIVMLHRNFAVLFIFYISYSWFTAISKSVLPTHLLSQNLNLQQMILGMLLGFLGQLILLITIKNLTSKLSWRLALICNALYVLLVVSVQNSYQFYLASLINGMVILLLAGFG